MESYEPKNPEGDKNLIDALDIAVNLENNLMVVVIKPDAFLRRDEIIKKLEDAGLTVVKKAERRLGNNFLISEMYKELPESIKEETIKHFNTGPSEVILLRGGIHEQAQACSPSAQTSLEASGCQGAF